MEPKLLHDIVWFFTIGRFDPTWVQAVASVLLVALSLVTLVVLCVYALDTHRLADVAVQQIVLARRLHSSEIQMGFHIAFDSVLKIQEDLTTLLRALVNQTFGNSRPPAVYPDNWPEITSALREHNPDVAQPAIQLGLKLRGVDFAVNEFFENNLTTNKEVFEALEKAMDGCKALTAVMMTARD